MVGTEYNKLRSVDVACDIVNNMESKLTKTPKYRLGLTLLIANL